MADRHLTEALDELLIAGGILTMRLLGREPPARMPDPSQNDWKKNLKTSLYGCHGKTHALVHLTTVVK